MKKLEGIFCPCVTFFDKTGNLDLSNTTEHIKYLIESGINGLFLLGSASEFAYLTDDEKWGKPLNLEEFKKNL